MKMRTWIFVDPPSDAKPLTCKWILRKKDNGIYKARLVARRFEQKEGRDYFSTFIPVARYESIRLILSIAAPENMKIRTFDVKTAFLNSKLKEEIFVYQPEGFNDGTGRVGKLLKSLCGLKQASKDWNVELTEFLESLGFKNTDDDPCIFYNQDSVIIVIFVDDGCIVYKDETKINKLLEKISDKFEITYDEVVKNNFSYLGMEIDVNENGIHLNQSINTQKILNHFGFDKLNSAAMPMERGMLIDEENFCDDKPLDGSTPYL